MANCIKGAPKDSPFRGSFHIRRRPTGTLRRLLPSGTTIFGGALKKALFLPSLAALFLPALACRSVDLSPYPASSRKTYIFNFTNRSFEPDINRELYAMVKSELLRRGNFLVTKERKEAALLLYGDVVAFQEKGLIYDNLRNPVHIRYSIVVRIKLFDSSRRQLLSRELFSHVNFSPSEGRRETERQARRRLSRILARDVANILERGFLNRNPTP